MASTIDSLLNLPGGSQAPIEARTPSNTIDQEGFLTLLVAQLQNQDPLEPLSNEEFVQQLTSFSSLDELREINKGVEGLGGFGDITDLLTASLAMQQANLNASAVSLIGQKVEAVSDGVVLGTGMPSEIGVLLPDTGAEKVTVALQTADGEILFDKEIDLSDPPEGVRIANNEVYIQVPMEDASGEPFPHGAVKIVATATADGEETQLTTTLLGRVDGIDFRDEQTLITLAGTRIDLANVLEIGADDE